MTVGAYHLSPELEDYLETIAVLTQSEGKARVTDIAARLSVRKPSVTLALRSLAGKGLVRYAPYLVPTLTKAGQRIAARVQHRHDALKQFLTDVLLIDAELAEANACRLEHAVDTEVLQHFTSFMNFVQRCPRGGAKWIRGYEYFCDPTEEGEKCERCMELALEEFRANRDTTEKEQASMTLDELTTGTCAKILRVGKTGSIRRRLVDMGAVNGTVVEVVKVAPLGDPIEIKMRGYNLTLRKQEAGAITVETLPIEEA